MKKTVWVLLCSAVLCWLVGCGASSPDAVDVGGGEAADTSPSQDESPGLQGDGASPLPVTLAVEHWEAQFLQGTKVGFAHLRRATLTEDGRGLVELTSSTMLTIKRAGQTVTQELVYGSVETPSGQVVRFETSLSGAGDAKVTRGRVDGGKLHIDVTTSGHVESRTMEWDPSWGGFFAVEHALQGTPMQPGEQRRLKSLVPFFLQVSDVQLEAFDYEVAALLSDERELLKIKKTIQLPGDVRLVEWIWCDRDGQALKSRLEGGLGGEAYRTSKEIATGDLDDVAFDLFRTATVKVDQLPADPHRKRRIVYRVRMNDGNPDEVFVGEPGQLKESIDESTIRLTAIARGLDGRLNDAEGTERPVDEDRQPNSVVQSDDEQVIRLAQSVAPDEKNVAKLAAALEQYVGQYVQQKDFSRALATAAEVAATGQGDCTEHAVLLAALCRARGLPARVVIGLVASPRDGGFAYHMWNEVWVEDRWVPLDATLGMGGVGPAHLKLRHTNLHGVSPYAAFLPVYQVLGRLEIDIEKVE